MEKDKQTGWKKTNRPGGKRQTDCGKKYKQAVVEKRTNVLMFLEYIDDLY